MSGGIGATQRRLLALLEQPVGGPDLGRDMDSLARLLHGSGPSPAQSHHVRRAVAGLQDRVLVTATPGAGTRVHLTPAGRAWLTGAAAFAVLQQQLTGPAAPQ